MEIETCRTRVLDIQSVKSSGSKQALDPTALVQKITSHIRNLFDSSDHFGQMSSRLTKLELRFQTYDLQSLLPKALDP